MGSLTYFSTSSFLFLLSSPFLFILVGLEGQLGFGIVVVSSIYSVHV